VKFEIVNLLRVAPATFWDELFFDEAYNQSLYAALGFVSMRVLSFDRQATVVRRGLQAEPPIHAPAALKRKLTGKVFYSEEGELDLVHKRWTFRSNSSVMPDQVSIRGQIELLPHAEGALHRVEIDARVNAWGIGSVIEHLIERNTRESYDKTIAFTERWAREKGLV
jgi:hypothetical protein